MSQQEFERTDQEVMDLVNSAASPQAKQMVDAIENELNQPAVPKPRCENDECAEECVSRAVVEELHREWKRKTVIVCSLQAFTGIVVAVVMMIAMKRPEWVVHIANVTVLIAGIVAALRIEKIIKLLRK